MSDLTPTQIAAWFRQQAAQFTQVADMVESTFKSGVAAPVVPKTASSVRAPAKQHIDPTAFFSLRSEDIKSAIRLKGMRTADAAKHFNVDNDTIHSLVTSPGSGLSIGDRGWIKENPSTTS